MGDRCVPASSQDTSPIPHQCYHFGMSGLESVSHGDELLRKAIEAEDTRYPLDNPRVQGALSQLLYPTDPEHMMKWVTGDDASDMPPLSAAYREYIEHADMNEIDINDTPAMQKLLEEVKARAKETLH